METNKKLSVIFDTYKANKNVATLLDDFVDGIISQKNEKDPSWELSAQNLLKAVTLSLLQNPKTTKERFILTEIKRVLEMGTIEHTDIAFKNNNTKQTRLIDYFKNQSLECRELADSVVSNSYNTFMNIICLLYTYLTRAK